MNDDYCPCGVSCLPVSTLTRVILVQLRGECSTSLLTVTRVMLQCGCEVSVLFIDCGRCDASTVVR